MGKREQLCILTLYSVHPTAYVDGAGDGGGGQRGAGLGEQQVRRILCCAEGDDGCIQGCMGKWVAWIHGEIRL